MIPYETLLDLARQRLEDLGGSPKRTRTARNIARSLAREVASELQAHNDGRPLRRLVAARPDCVGLGAAPAWGGNEEELRAA